MINVNYVDQGAGRYVVGDAAPYDQKNEMFKRPFWDPAAKDLEQKFYFTPVKPGQKPGYRLADIAATNAAWRLEREYALGVRGGINNARWLNKLFLWGDDVFGYGRKGDTDKFWQADLEA